MRTTITLDDDVYSAIKEEMKKGDGKTFKDSVNDLIRRGRYTGVGHSRKRRTKRPTFNMGARVKDIDLDKPRDIIEKTEGTWHR